VPSRTDDVSILLGDGTGNFSAATNFGVGTTPFSVAVGDFNDDANQDLAVVNEGTDDVSILLGNGDGTFQPAVNYGTVLFPVTMAVGDFNGDGNQDLAVGSEDLDDVSILLGNGDGTFQEAANVAVGSTVQSVVVGDFNGDAMQDLACATAVPANGISILLGNGDGTFSAPSNFGAGDSPKSVAVGDFNGDAMQDLAVANLGSDDVSILLRNCAPPCSWGTGPDLPFAGARFVGVYFPGNGKFYVMGGYDVNNVEFTQPFEYDPATNSWTTKSALYPDQAVNDMACSVLNDSGIDYIYCAGGWEFDVSETLPGFTTSRVFRYDPITDVITDIPASWPPGDIDIFPGGFTVLNNKLYILGGFRIVDAVDQIWEFTPNPAGWVFKNASLPVPLAWIPTTTIDGLIYTGGGAATPGGVLTDTQNSFVYDPVADSINTIADIPRPTSNTRAVNFCNQMYVLGGGSPPSNEVDIYDPVSNTWSVGIPFPTAGRNFTADTDGISNIWKAGGYAADGVTKIATTEIFNCVCASFSLTPTALGKAKPTIDGRDVGGFSPKGIRPQAVPDAARQAVLNLKVQNLQAMIPQQQQQIKTLTAQVNEQATQIQKVNAQLEKMSKPEAKMVRESLQTAKTTKEN